MSHGRLVSPGGFEHRMEGHPAGRGAWGSGRRGSSTCGGDEHSGVGGAESCTTPGWGQTGGAPEKQTVRETGQKVSQKPRENKCQENGQSDKHSTQARQDKH